ncbi:MAG: cytochrome C [Paracoccaceae bacterium]
MNKSTLLAALSVLALAAPAFADGDAAKGENDFKKCKACHSITAPDGTDVVKGGKTGPNLYGVVGRAVASDPDFKYGEGILAVGAKGEIWDQKMIEEYVIDPTKWIDEQTGDTSLKSKMTFKLAKHGEDVAAYLASIK